MLKPKFIILALVLLLGAAPILRAADFPQQVALGVPGTVINYVHPSTGFYVGSPSIAAGADGVLYASHDLFSGSPFAGQAKERDNNTTLIFVSRDQGKSWAKVAEVKGQYWSRLFFHRDQLYLLGTDKIFGSVVIRRSKNGGVSWTIPVSEKNGLLLKGSGYHAAPGPIVEHDGRLWKAFEQIPPGVGWGGFGAFLMSIPVNSDLLDAGKWKQTEKIYLQNQVIPTKETSPTLLEGNVVMLPDGRLGCLYRYNSNERPLPGKALLLIYNSKTNKLDYDKESSWINFDHPYAKFAILRDPVDSKYWAVSNRAVQNNPSFRSKLGLSSSNDVRSWHDAGDLLVHTGNPEKVAFQYPDAVISGDDLLIVTRSALNGARNYHDANYLLFHRIPHFRDAGNRAAQKLPLTVPTLTGFKDQVFKVQSIVEIPLYFTGDPESIAIEGLPPGLRYEQDRAMIFGVPHTAGDFQVSVTAKNALGSGELAKIKITITPLTIR